VGHFLRQIFFALVAAGNHAVPKRKQLVLHAFPDVEDQMVAVLRWLQANPEHACPVICLISGSEAEARSKLQRLLGDYVFRLRIIRKTRMAAVWAYWRSRHVLFTHGLYGFWPTPPGQVVVNLWHGMPLKRIWRGLPGSLVPDCTWLLSTSDIFSDVLARASGFAREKIPPIGLPRNDLLFSCTPAVMEFDAEVRQGVKKVIFFLPTYRQSKVGFETSDGVESGDILAMKEAEVGEFRKMLKARGIRLLVKPHPMSVHYGREEKVDDWLWIISDRWLQEKGIVLYEALGRMDALITDVSSVYVDFLSRRRPVFFYFPDLVEYRRTRAFLLEPVEQWLAGPLCVTAEGLILHLDRYAQGHDDSGKLLATLAEQLNPQTSPDASARLMQFLQIGSTRQV
jgi:CDP-glycerol glycerophosphotransferase (TagB/SpsB family)